MPGTNTPLTPHPPYRGMARLGLVVATFHEAIVEQMEDQARERAEVRGAEVAETYHVPGVYDTVLAADRLARRRTIDAVVVIGAVITGETGHDEAIAQATMASLQAVSRDRDTPVTLGVTGPGMTAAQAQERLDYGEVAVEAALDLLEEVGDQS